MTRYVYILTKLGFYEILDLEKRFKRFIERKEIDFKIYDNNSIRISFDDDNCFCVILNYLRIYKNRKQLQCGRKELKLIKEY